MITKALDLAPRMMLDELLRLGRLDRNWLIWENLPDGHYRARFKYESWLRRLMRNGADAFGMWAGSVWLVDGPKIFRPTIEQCEALEQVEVRLSIHEYAQPYPALLVDLPDPERYAPFDNVLCHFDTHQEPVLSCCLHSVTNLDDIVTTIKQDDGPIEASIQRYDTECSKYARSASLALRVAINSCLALTNYDHHKEILLAKQVENDRRLAQEQSERGRRARQRLRDNPPLQLISFDREIKLHRTIDRDAAGSGTGKEKSAHWRRGHWAMQAHGPGNSLRKRILRLPVMVRADRFLGDIADTSTSYKG